MSGEKTPQARLIGPSTALKQKARDSVRFDQASLARVEKTYATFVQANKGWCKTQAEALSAAFGTWPASGSVPRDASRALFGLAHDLRGLGTTLGYPLLTATCDSLCKFLDERDLATDDLRIVKLHVDMVALVVTNDMQGDGGELGRSLMTDLRHAVAERQGKG